MQANTSVRARTREGGRRGVPTGGSASDFADPCAATDADVPAAAPTSRGARNKPPMPAPASGAGAALLSTDVVERARLTEAADAEVVTACRAGEGPTCNGGSGE
jgi:hypothetical protein